MILADVGFDTGTCILFTVLAFLATAGCTVFLVIRAIRDSRKYRESVASEGILRLEAFKKLIERAINGSTRKNRFLLFQIDINDYDKNLKLLGEEQMRAIVKEQCLVLSKLESWGIKVGLRADDSIIMLMRYNDNLQTESLCQLIINSVAKNYVISQDLSIELSVNVAAESYPEAGDSVESLLSSLDISMVTSKRKGENKYVLYSPQFANVNTEEYKYYQEIHEAIKANEFILYYQCIVDTNSYEVCGAETLIRWSHRTKGVLPPAEFLYVMEQTGDINWVGLWCFNSLVSQTVQWNANYDQRFNTAINVSERQLVNPEFAEEIKKIIRKRKATAAAYTLEISNLMLYKTNPLIKANIDTLRQAGVKICLDGFGSDFASPTALEQLPVDSIKIDRAFWNKISDSKMIQNIIELLLEYARDNSIQLIAVGVETKEEIDTLRKIGINYMQGYIFSKPKDARDFIGDVVFTPWSEELK